MPSKRKKNNRFKAFEGIKENDRHVRLTECMITSPAWVDLKATSIKLYVAMKLRYNGSNTEVEFPYSEAAKYISKNTINPCLDDLIIHGLIEISYEGRTNRKANIYRFSDKWQRWPHIDVRRMSNVLFGSLNNKGCTTPKTEGSKEGKTG